MGILDNETIYKKIDKQGMLQNIKDLANQVEDAWEKVRKFAIPTHYLKANNVVILGMGGSAIGGDLTIGLVKEKAKVPVVVNRDYNLPNFVDSSSLVIAVSYSGDTEETVTSFQEAAKAGAKLLAISSGGKIASLCRKYRVPMYKIDYGAMPRAAIGYTFLPIIGIFYKLGWFDLGKNEVSETVLLLKSFQKKIDIGVPTSQNLAKQLADKLKDRIPIMVGSGSMSSVARRAKTQFNENSKVCADFDELPELCHNSIVGLDFPSKLRDKVFVVILESIFNHQRNRLRQQILGQILQKKGIDYESIFLNPKGGPLSEVLHNILFVDYVSYYLAMLNNIDPTEIPSINYLKDKLAEVR